MRTWAQGMKFTKSEGGMKNGAGALRDGRVVLNPGRRLLRGTETVVVVGPSQKEVSAAAAAQFQAARPRQLQLCLPDCLPPDSAASCSSLVLPPFVLPRSALLVLHALLIFACVPFPYCLPCMRTLLHRVPPPAVPLVLHALPPSASASFCRTACPSCVTPCQRVPSPAGPLVLHALPPSAHALLPYCLTVTKPKHSYCQPGMSPARAMP